MRFGSLVATLVRTSTDTMSARLAFGGSGDADTRSGGTGWKSEMINVWSSSQLGSTPAATFEPGTKTDVDDPDGGKNVGWYAIFVPSGDQIGPERFRSIWLIQPAQSPISWAWLPSVRASHKLPEVISVASDPVIRRLAVCDRRAVRRKRSERSTDEVDALTPIGWDRPQHERPVADRRVQDGSTVRAEIGIPDRSTLTDEAGDTAGIDVEDERGVGFAEHDSRPVW